MPEPRRAGGYPSGHPESREAGHPGAAEDRVSRVGRARALSREPHGPVCRGQSARAGLQESGGPTLLIGAPGM